MKMKEKGLKVISATLLMTMLAYTAPVFAYTKDETVYSKLDTDGKNYKTIVSTHIENKEQEELIKDLSDLLNIENTNGEEEFTKEGNSLIWKANKEDIYYEGESQKDLPIECKVSYRLDGKEIEAKDLAGKSGKVTITLEYINKDVHTVKIDGKNEKLYTPFVVVAGTVFKNDKNKNITISSGKIIDDGTKSIAIGMAMPGLQESLGISKKQVEIPSSIEITMEAEDFESNNILAFVTPKMIEESDLEIFDELDKLYSKVNTLQSSANQIQEGSKALAQGSNQLKAATKELKSGSGVAYAGVSKIKSEVEKSVKALESDKSEALDEKTITAIGMGAAQTAEEQMEKSATAIGKQAENAVAGVKLTDKDKANIIAGVKAGLEANANYKALPETEQAMILEFAKATAISSSETVAQNTAKKVANQTAQNVAKSTAGQVAKETAENTAKEVASQVKSAAQSQVVKQMGALGKGLNELTNGLSKLDNGAKQLQAGTSELSDKTNELSEGVAKFNKEGIKQIYNYVNGNVKNISKRVEKLTDLANEYNHFTMLNGNNSGNVKFIMIIDAIKKQEENDHSKEQAILNTDENKQDNENSQKSDN